jgi:hypothetical protein
MARKGTAGGAEGKDSAGQRGGRWKNLDAHIRGHGDVTIGRVGPVSCAAVASDSDQMLAALVRRRRESLEELLDRLDAALQRRWDEDVVIDEING